MKNADYLSHSELITEIDRLENQVSRQVGEIQIQKDRHAKDLKSVKERAKAPFTRRDMEGMTHTQLLSLVQAAITACRSTGMLEAEGLVSRHSELMRETDLEMMRGIVKNYQDRIKALELEKAKATEAAKVVSIDTRPLRDKLAPATASAIPERGTSEDYSREYVGWWRNPTPKEEQQGYQLFDLKAQQVTQRAKAQQPPNTLKEGESVHVAGDGMYMYDLKRVGDVYSCTCKSWEFQTAVPDRRTCKHLGRYLGKDVEEKRVTRPQPSCWCGVLLIRGQCQMHTTNWRGEEHCECGRAFWFCNEEARAGRHYRGVNHKPRIAS